MRRFAGLIRPGGSVLDVACGSGRHLRWLAAQGHAVTGIDRDERAIEASTRLCQRLGFSDREMAFRCESADDPAARDLTPFDLVYLAALVGDTQQAKEDLLLAVANRMQPGALLLIRSAWGLRTFLYPVRPVLFFAYPWCPPPPSGMITPENTSPLDKRG